METSYKPYIRNCEVFPDQIFPEGMTRVALGIEYNGRAYHGFQAQRAGVRTIQRELEAALSYVANEPVTLICAGRTDAGVHATNQTIHFDTLAVRKDRAWVLGTNTQLPDDIGVRWAKNVVPQFHARFSARRRAYRYVIYNGSIRPALQHDQLSFCHRPLVLEQMRKAAAFLEGEHDFTSFRASQCQANSPVRTVHRLDLARIGDLVIIEIEANAFLHHMVRNIAGALMSVGAGDNPPEWVADVLAAKDRSQGAATAPAGGLYLTTVHYPDEYGLPAPLPGPHFLTYPLGQLPQ